jgi:hypothetical protein
MPAGTPIICRSSRMQRTLRSSARRIASMGTRCRVRTYGLTLGREREHVGHACARRSGGFGARLPAWDALANLVVPLVALARTWSACSTTPSWDNLTRIWEPAGCLPQRMSRLTE